MAGRIPSPSSCLCPRHVVLYTKVTLLSLLLLLHTIHARPAVVKKPSSALQLHPPRDAGEKDPDINVLGKPDSKEELDVNHQRKIVVNEDKEEEKGALEKPLENNVQDTDLKAGLLRAKASHGQPEHPKQQLEMPRPGQAVVKVSKCQINASYYISITHIDVELKFPFNR